MRSYSDTWKAIAQHVGRSEKWCRYMAKRPVDPLPVYRVGGVYRLDHADYDAWLERQKIAHRLPTGPTVDAAKSVDPADSDHGLGGLRLECPSELTQRPEARDSRDCSAAVDATPPLRVS